MFLLTVEDNADEPGRSLNALRGRYPQASFAGWMSKCFPFPWWTEFVVSDVSEGHVFPWEDLSRARVNEPGCCSLRPKP